MRRTISNCRLPVAFLLTSSQHCHHAFASCSYPSSSTPCSLGSARTHSIKKSVFSNTYRTASTSPSAAFLAPPFFRGGSSKITKPTIRTMSTTETTVKATTNDDHPGRVALLQFKVTPDKSTNHQTAISNLSQAAAQNAKLAVMPEIWNGPYATAAFPEYAESIPSVGYQYDASTSQDELKDKSPSSLLLLQQAIEHGMYIVGGSISENEDGKIYNTCICIDPKGLIVAKHRKVHLFDIDVPGGITFKESDTLSPGNGVTFFNAGDYLGRIGVGICYDIRFPEYSLLLSQNHKCNILIFPGAFNLTTGPAHWELLQRGRAVDNQCFVLTASPARTEAPPSSSSEDAKYPHYTAWGHSTAVTPWADVLATCDEKEHVVICDLEIEKVKEMREGIPTGYQKRNDLYNLSQVD